MLKGSRAVGNSNLEREKLERVVKEGEVQKGEKDS